MLHSHIAISESTEKMATLNFYCEKVRYLSNEEAWPKEIRTFYEKSPGDTDSLKSPHLNCPWILLPSQIWAPEKEKRAQQINCCKQFGQQTPQVVLF